MWNSLFQAGLAVSTADFTNELSWLTIGLASVVLLSAAAIVSTVLAGRKDEQLLRKALLEEVSYHEAA
ncbi:MAG: hypothetical protein AB7P69_12885 [Candidatus Binatia bacterium]